MSLRRFRKQKFYKGGAEAAFAVSKNINFLPVLMNFLIKHIKKMRKINRLVKFLQKFFKLVIKSSNYPIKGVKIKIKGRINGANRARTRFLIVGDVPCNSVNTNLKHMSSHLHNRKGSLGLKIWLAEEQI